jgi:hypothetical protein
LYAVNLSADASSQPKKVSKQKKRQVGDKVILSADISKAAKAQQEKEREQRIQEEKKNTVSYRDLENTALLKKLLPLGFRVKEVVDLQCFTC